jgi:glycosyltransferase involved in cell wall biosynthesis
MQGSEEQLRIKILTSEPFPVGLAASNRIMTYAKGFAEQNCKISVHCFKPSERPDKIFNHSSSGTIDGIYYSYSGGKTILDRRFINRRIDNLIGIVKISYELLREKKSNKTDAIIYYSELPVSAMILYLITRIKHILFLKEESEIPEVYLGTMNLIQKILFKKLHYPLFDGLLLMTNRLIHYFKIEKKTNTPLLHVPMTVNFSRFSEIQESDKTVEYIAYCGALNDKKDGINVLIDAFVKLAREFPHINLYLIGEASTQDELDQYTNQINLHKLSDRVVFTGRVSKDTIPKLLAYATILVLPRPISLQAEGGFPTKLGEYLSTGKPVVVTKVGEIPDYLTDGVNAFMAEPGSVDSLASKLKDVLMDYENAKTIGENGKKTVIESFNYQVQTKNILNFIKSFQTL